MRLDVTEPPGTATPRAAAPARIVVLGILPFVLLAGLVVALVRFGPGEALKGEGYPPVERLAFERVTLTEGGIHLSVLNDGPDPLTIAQVQVDEAYWAFSVTPRAPITHLRRATIDVPYPWVRGDTHNLRLVTASGVTFDHQIAVAVQTPAPGLRFFMTFTLIGLYVGVIPVAIGLLWFPVMARLGRRGLDFLLALTVGLLLFLLVDAGIEGLDAAADMAASYQGTALLVFVAIGAYLGLEMLGGWLRARRQRLRVRTDQTDGGRVLALLIAVGIGIHNFGEGLAVGAAFSLGEAALGSLLIVGFALHNATEGLAIVAPLARSALPGTAPPRITELLELGLIGGLPTIAGAWLGGFVYSVLWSVIFLAIGAGAIAQVVAQILRQTSGDDPIAHYVARPHVMAGLMTGFAVMYATGMLIG